ncbi:MucR family transcriptional regulator [Fodinicurvata sp. EGI_FJ10296]|uniref:MucR family transcriptional regulator n=1 Tax=Fodinicurvata sp. EGI_FJ10296 TaxID=3231908 RepID=UPI0034549447
MYDAHFAPIQRDRIVRDTANIICAYLRNNPVDPIDLPSLITSVSDVLSAVEASSQPPTPAVPLSQSVHSDYIICLEDGHRTAMLRPYLKRQYDLTPEAYRLRWGLPATYPMTAPGYSQRRRRIAKQIGLGIRWPMGSLRIRSGYFARDAGEGLGEPETSGTVVAGLQLKFGENDSAQVAPTRCIRHVTNEIC